MSMDQQEANDIKSKLRNGRRLEREIYYLSEGELFCVDLQNIEQRRKNKTEKACPLSINKNN